MGPAGRVAWAGPGSCRRGGASRPWANKKAGTCRPRLPLRFRVGDPSVGQPTPGSAGKHVISVSVIDIEMICLVIMPVGAPSAATFMLRLYRPLAKFATCFTIGL